MRASSPIQRSSYRQPQTGPVELYPHKLYKPQEPNTLHWFSTACHPTHHACIIPWENSEVPIRINPKIPPNQRRVFKILTWLSQGFKEHSFSSLLLLPSIFIFSVILLCNHFDGRNMKILEMSSATSLHTRMEYICYPLTRYMMGHPILGCREACSSKECLCIKD